MKVDIRRSKMSVILAKFCVSEEEYLSGSDAQTYTWLTCRFYWAF